MLTSFDYQGDLLTVGKLKGIDDFDLSQVLVREKMKVSLRFNNFTEAL
jgi:hypothetical protein